MIQPMLNCEDPIFNRAYSAALLTTNPAHRTYFSAFLTKTILRAELFNVA
jgi:hypothetical protein